MYCVVVYALLVAILTIPSRGDVTNTSPGNGACLCLNANLNMRSSACGSVVVTANSGECYKYLGIKQRCSLSGTSYEFFQIDYKGTGRWGAGTYLDLSSDTRCGGGDIANPRNGACMCLTDNVNMRSSACGSVVVTATSGECYKYLGTKQTCSLSGTSYDFLKIDYKGTARWAAGSYLELSADSKCGTGSSPAKVPSAEGYTCRIANQGKRIHETTSPTSFDCRDCEGGNTCKGGQCVAYVTCSCTRDGKHVPNTSCWRPGTRVKKSDGTCNSDIPINTAIATFKNSTGFYGHAAVFMGCSDSHTIRVYDQGCGKAIGYSSYGSGHRYFSQFAVITNPGVCPDRSSWSCRTEDSGAKSCCSYTKQCSDKAKNKCV